MPTLILDDVPADVYDGLRRAATKNQRSVTVEAVQRLQRTLDEVDGPQRVAYRDAPPRLPDPPILDEAISAPFDLPRPGVAEMVRTIDVEPPLPDPIPEAEDSR